MYDDLIHVKTKSGATIRREMSQTTVDVSEIRKEGYVLKESAIIRQYRKRWLVLTRTHLYSFKKDRSYTDPTEVRGPPAALCPRWGGRAGSMPSVLTGA